MSQESTQMEHYAKRARTSRTKARKGFRKSGGSKWGYSKGAQRKWYQIQSVSANNHLLPIKNPDVFTEHLNTNLYWQSRQQVVMTAIIPYNGTAIRANSLFDPDFTNGTDNDQPKFFDILCGASSPYQYYRVNSCYIEVLCYKMSTSSQSPFSAYLFPSQSVYSGPLSDSVCETARNAEKGTSAVIGGDGTCTRMCAFATTKDMIGPFNDFGSSAAIYSASPASLWYMNLVFDADNGPNADTQTILVDMRIKWNVTFFQDNELNDS